MTSENVVGVLKRLGDVSGGDQERLERLALAFGQISAKGHLAGQELNQLIEGGINVLAEVSRTTGRSMEDLYKAMEKGEISVAMVDNAFKTATSSGGRFAGALDRQGQTIKGVFGQLRDAAQQAAVSLGNALLPMTRELIGRATAVATTVKKMAR